MVMGGFFGYGQPGHLPSPRNSGRIDKIVDGMMAGRRAQGNQDARQAAIGEGIRRFQGIGTDEAMRIAQMMGENPRGASMYAETLGGWEKLYNQYKSNALGMRAAEMQAGAAGGAGVDASAEEYFQALVAAGFPHDQAAQMAKGVADLRYTQSQTEKNRRPPGLELREIYDPESPTGTRFATEQDALGQPGKPGSGMTVTSDGEGAFELIQGRGAGQPGQSNLLGKKAFDETQRRIMVNAEAMDRMKEIQGTFEERFLTLPTKLEAMYYAGKEIAGIDLDPDEAKLVGDYDDFRSNVLENLNLYIKDITGAQMSEKEAERIEKAIINLKKSPTEFKRGMRRIMKTLMRRDRMQRYMLNHGLIQDGHDFNSSPSPVSEYAFKKVREKRLDAIYKDLSSRPVEPGTEPPTPEDLKMMAVKQFDEDQRNGVTWDG